jgi:hypothetical protein
MASIAQMMQAATPDPVADLPRFSDVARPVQGNTTRNPLAAGVSSGIDQMQGAGGAFVAAMGDIIGSQGIKDWGVGVAQRNAAEAAKNGRADLSRPIWEQNITDLPAWLGFRTAQQLPQMATQLAGGAVLGRGLARAGAALPDSVAEVGARVPKLLGGAGAGLEGAVSREALEQGRKYATDVAGATIAGYPMAVGSMYGEAIDRGDPNKGDAIAAAIAGPAYAALDAMGPVQLKNLALNGSKGKIAARLLTGVFAGAASEAPQEAVQTAMELAFRPDLSPQEKFKSIVDAAVTGAAIGGFLGGGAGIRRTKSPAELTNDEAKTNIDTALAGAAKGPAPDLKLEPTEEGQAAPVRPHAAEPIERVQSMLADVESRFAAGGGTQQDAINRKQLRDELGARAAETQNRPFAQVPEAELMSAVQAAQGQGVTPDLLTAAQQAQAELDARAQEGAALQKAVKIGPNQPGPQDFDTPQLPGFAEPLKPGARPKLGDDPYQLPVQRSPEAQYKFEEPIRQAQDARAAATAEATYESTQAAQRKVADLMGLKSIPKALDKAGIKTEEDGFAYIAERLRKGNPSDAVLAAGKQIGLLDEDGNDQTVETIQQKMAANKERATSIMQKAKLTGAKQYTVQLQKMSQENQKLTAQLDMVRRTDEAVKLRDRERNPPTEIRPGPAQMRTPDGKMVSVTVEDSAPTNVQGKLFQSIKNEKGVQAFVPIETLYSSSVPAKEAKAATSPAAQQAEARRPIPMNKREPGIPDLKSPLWQNTEVGQEVTPREPRGEVYREPLLEETSAQRQARMQARGQYFGGEQDPNTVPSQSNPNLYDEAANAGRDVKRYEPMMSEIISNKSLPKDLRKMASKARSLLRQGGGYTETVQQVLADYSAQTGDMQFSEGAVTFGRRASDNPDTNARIDAVLNTRNILDPERRAALRERALAMLEQDAQDFANNPDGPFTGAKENVVLSESVDPRYGALLRDLMQLTGMGNIRVFLHSPADTQIAENYKLHGPYASAARPQRATLAGGVTPFGIGGRDFAMVIAPGRKEEQTIETIAHELGHMVWHVALANAPDATRQAIRNDYLKWKAANENKNAEQVIKALRNRHTSAATILATDPRALSQTLNKPELGDDNPANYWLGENEWFADQVSRWATTSKKPVSVVEKFFAKIAQMMRIIQKYITGQSFMPAQSVKEFLDGMGANSAPFQWEGYIGKYSLVEDRIVGAKPTIENMLDQAEKADPKTMNARLKELVGSSDVILDKLKAVPLAEASDKLNIAHLWTTTINHIVDYFGPLFKPGTLAGYRDTLELQRGLANRMAHLQAAGYQMWEAMSANPATKKAADGTLKLMDATFSDIDPRKKWEEHKHLHDMPNADVLKARVLEANELYRNQQRIVLPDGRRASDVYDTLLAANEMERYASQAVSLFNLVKGDASVVQSHKDALVDPVVQFMQDPKVFEDPLAAREYWRAQRDALVTSTSKYVEDQLGRLGSTTDANAKKARKSTDTIANFVKMIQQQDERMQQAPYFHVGRFGDYFASYRVKLDDKGNVSQAMLQQMAKAIEAAGMKLSVPVETTVDRMFFRFETQDEAIRFEELMKQFEKKGFITRLPREGQTEGQDPKLGKRGDSSHEPRAEVGSGADLPAQGELRGSDTHGRSCPMSRSHSARPSSGSTKAKSTSSS